jgi:hypothetical protein
VRLAVSCGQGCGNSLAGFADDFEVNFRRKRIAEQVIRG